MRKHTIDEPGCIDYRFWSATDDPNAILLFEQWQEQSASGDPPRGAAHGRVPRADRARRRWDPRRDPVRGLGSWPPLLLEMYQAGAQHALQGGRRGPVMAEAIAERVRRYILDGGDEDLRRLLGVAETAAELA